MHEQQGTRPAIVIGLLPRRTRYLLAIVAPLKTQKGKWREMNPIIYPTLNADAGNLQQMSVVLLGQTRTLDARQLLQYIGRLKKEDYQPIAKGISLNS